MLDNDNNNKETFEFVDDMGKAAAIAEESPMRKLKASPQPPQRSFISNLIDYAEVFVFSICVVILLFTFVARICQVKGPSMQKTLYDGETLVVSDLFYEPKREDIIVFHQTGTYNEPIVKRVIAVGGETVDINFDTMEIKITDKNGETFLLDEEAYRYLDTGNYIIRSSYLYPIEVPEGMLFVLGDNRNHSSDSRHYSIGLVDERRVLGKVIFRLSPIDKIGTVD